MFTMFSAYRFNVETPIKMGKLKLLGLASTAALGGSYLNFKIQDNRRVKLQVPDLVQPEQMVAGINMIAVAKTMFGMMPSSLREKLLISAAAPAHSHIPRETWDLYKQSPYTIEKVNLVMKNVSS